MAFTLGNHYIDEILYCVAENDQAELLYSLDQLSSASIEISADSTDITDKKGNIIRTTYRTKTGTFTATNALLHPAVMNAQSGEQIKYAGTGSGQSIAMPKIFVVDAGTTIQINDYDSGLGSIQVIGLYGNGANAEPLSVSAAAACVSGTAGSQGGITFTAPDAGTGLPIQYLIKYDRSVTEGAMLTNNTKSLPNLVKLTLFCAMGDPCKNDLRPCYVVIPRFSADPSMTISLDAEETTVDFSGNLNVDYCSGTQALYYIYYPEEELVVSGTVVSA